jgi:sulfatase maturation enzyme AslB (radical SAM superfamily)
MQKIDKNRISAEIFSAATCPLDCKYCYIPKTNSLTLLQKNINEYIAGKKFITKLKSFYGKNLTYLGLWGAEPTTNLKLIEKTIQPLIKEFPKLSIFSFSTSLLTDPNIILSFINRLVKTNKKIEIKIQVSLDGPDFITDKNRRKGAAKEILINFFYLSKGLNKINLKQLRVEFHFKATFTIENIKLLNKNPILIKKYFDYFDNICDKQSKINKNPNVYLVPTFNPTLTVPGKYTSKDGEILSLFFKKLRILSIKNKKNKFWKYAKNSLNVYVYRFDKLIKEQKEIFINQHKFTCSGGDSNFGIDIKNNVHICHRTFFLNEKNYLNDIFLEKNTENWDISLFSKGNINLINKNYNIKKKGNNKKTLYVLRNYHDFTKIKNSYIIAMLKELALAGQADKIYLKDDNLCMMFALFINSAFSCPAENLLNTGIIHFTPVSIIRLLANGAFNEILKDHYENIPARE